MTRPIVMALKMLSDAYPEKRVEAATLQVYLQHLDDIPPGLLKQAVEAHIKESPWFPKVSELRQMAAKIAGVQRFETLSPPGGDTLAERVQALEDQFYAHRQLDPPAWERLAAAFERADRPHRAVHTREKLRRLRSLLPQEGGAEGVETSAGDQDADERGYS